MEDHNGFGSPQNERLPKQFTEDRPADDDTDDGDIQTLFPPNLAELIVLDESGCEDEVEDDVEEGELKLVSDSEVNAIVNGEGSSVDVKEVVRKEKDEAGTMVIGRPKADDRDSDIEIVSGGESSNSFDSRESYLLDGDLNCSSEMQCQGLNCPFKIRLYSFVKRYRHVKRELKRLKKSTRSRMEIKFPDKSLAKKYRNVIENFVNNLLTSDTNCSSSRASPSTNMCGDTMLNESFTIDKSGQNESPFIPSLAGIRSPPFFERRFSESLLCMKNTNDEKPKTDNMKLSKMSCFNCLGEHTIAECMEPRDMNRITQNRNDFMSKKQNSNSPRYHVEENRNGKFAPGKLSNALRDALGLKRSEIPIHIYKMRIFGYPPGWLKETEIHDSGITVYNSDGKAEQVHYTNSDESDPPQNTGHDSSKLVEFPGFNVPLQAGMIDDWQKMGFIPMQEAQMKHVVEREMKDATPNKQKTSPDIETIESIDKHQKVYDMEVEEGMEIEECKTGFTSVGDVNGIGDSEIQLITPVFPTTSVSTEGVENSTKYAVNNPTGRTEVMLQSKITPHSSDKSYNNSEVSDVVSLSLEDLESAKQQLITALGSDLAEKTVICKSTPAFTGKTKAIYIGSPAIYQASCYLRLPNADKFAVGISEHMNFENLPNSTGSFEKMRNVLKGLRKCLLGANK